MFVHVSVYVFYTCFMKVVDRPYNLTQLQYTDTGRTSSSTDPILPGVQYGSHYSVHSENKGSWIKGQCSQTPMDHFWKVMEQTLWKLILSLSSKHSTLW